MADAEDKKHDPSEKKLRDAADRGELPRSPELSGVGSTIAVAATLSMAGAAITAPVVEFARMSFGRGTSLDLPSAVGLFQSALVAIASAAGIPLVAAGLAGTVLGFAQTRFQIAPRVFEARLDHLDPWATFQRLYLSREPLVGLAKGILHVAALGGVTAYAVSQRVETLPRVASLPAAQLGPLLADLGWGLVVNAVPVMVALAAVDYGWSAFTWWQNLKRTDQEVKDDHKESEGDPHVRAQRRRRMREIATRNVMRQLKEADVLVTNPTHFAVGLRYRHGVDAAPVVVVKAIDHLAVRLRQEAYRQGIPRVEDRLLARALYAQVPRGKRVPASLYGPVAKVLAVVYKRRRRR
ncbi:MAG: EscU/YscU/HrcU family type III secretion system export apparatus switch protein [Myxococcota bacterium]